MIISVTAPIVMPGNMEAVHHDRLKVCYQRLKGAMVAILREVSVKMMKLT